MNSDKGYNDREYSYNRVRKKVKKRLINGMD